MTRPTYTTTVERGASWWIIRVDDVPGSYSQTRRLDQAEAATRDMLAALLDVPADSFDLVMDVRLPDEMRRLLDALDAARREAVIRDEAARLAARDAAAGFVAMGLSVRDVGRVMGVSFQRAAQLAARR